LFGTEIFGFCALIKAFLSSKAIATVREKDKIRVQNVEIAVKEKLRTSSANKTLMIC